MVGVGACVQDAFELVGERASLKNRIWDARTGFSEVDRMLGGIASGDLVLAVAGPGEGKTSLALNVAVNAAKARARVLVFAPQENATRIGLRLLAPEARVPLQKLRRGRISEEDRIRVADAADRLAKLDITVSCEAISTLDSLDDAVRGWHTEGEALVVVDGLDLLAMGFVDGNRWPPDVSSAVLGLKNMALKLLNDKLRLPPDDRLYNVARSGRRPASRLPAVQNGMSSSPAPASGEGSLGGPSDIHHNAPSPGSAVHSRQAISPQSESTSQRFAKKPSSDSIGHVIAATPPPPP